MKTILVGLDLSSSSGPVAQCAIAIASSFRAEIIFLHVVNIPIPLGDYRFSNDEMFCDGNPRHRIVLNLMKGYALMAEKAGVHALTEVRDGPEVPTILSVAHDCSADLVVLGQRTHGALHEIFGGSVPRGVAKLCDVPVLLVPVASKELFQTVA